MSLFFKSKTQPFCRYCGKPIKKWTTTIYFGRNEPSSSAWSSTNPAYPETKADAQKLTNQRVVSISYTAPYWWKEKGENGGRRWIDHVTIWDGESYDDEYFCGTVCAARLGVLMARNGRCTTDYHAAVGRKQAKEDAA